MTNQLTYRKGTEAINREDGEHGFINSVCSRKRNGSPFSYSVTTQYGTEVWDASIILPLEETNTK